MLTDWLYWVGGFIVGAAGLLLLGWALFHDRARGRKRYPKCWYNLTGAEGDPPHTCPECGKVVKKTRKLYRTRRRKRWALAAVIPILGGIAIGLTPKIRENGWPSVVPNTPLIMVLRWSENDAAAEELFSHLQSTDPSLLYDEDALWAWQWDLLISSLYKRAREETRPQRIEWLFETAGKMPRHETSLRHLPEFCTSENATHREQAVLWIYTHAWSHHLYDESAADAIVDMVDDESPRARSFTLLAINLYGTRAEAAGPQLLKLLASTGPTGGALESCARALAATQTADDEAYELLLSRLPDVNHSRGNSVISALGYFAANRPQLAPHIVPFVEADDWYVRRSAISVLGAIGPDSELAVETLLQAAESEDPEVAQVVSYAIKRYPPDSEIAADILLTSMPHPGRNDARLALVRAGLWFNSPRLIDAAIEHATDTNQRLKVRCGAILACRYFHHRSLRQKDIQALLDALAQDDNSAIREAATAPLEGPLPRNR